MLNALPGAVGVSGLQVYDWPTADGLCGGSPHVHLTCAEAYVVVEGEGSVQTLTVDGYVETPLRPGTVAWFTPGTVHRLVNDDGRLRIVVVMQNSGLPEAGDAVFTFPPEILNDPRAYEHAASLEPGPRPAEPRAPLSGRAYDGSAGTAPDPAAAPPPAPPSREEPARRRRDLAIEGFARLRERTGAGDVAALHHFYRSAVRLKAHLFDDWEARWRAGAMAQALRTGQHLDRLRAGDIGHLAEAAIHRLEPPAERAFGMCGRLDTYTP